VAILLDVGLQFVLIDLDADPMGMKSIGTYDMINRMDQGDKVWEAIEKTVQELGSWMAEQGNVPLLIRYEGRRSTTMVSDSERQKIRKRSDVEGTLRD
jgi:hypothetical protein